MDLSKKKPAATCSCNCKVCNDWGTDKHCGKSENDCYKRSS